MNTPCRTAPSAVRLEYCDPRRKHRPHPADVLRRPGDAPAPDPRAASAAPAGRRASRRRSRCRPCRGRRARRPPTRPSASAPSPPAAVRGGVADDDEVAGELRLGLHPGLRAARSGRAPRRASRRPPPARCSRHLVVEGPPTARDMVAELDRRAPGRPGQELRAAAPCARPAAPPARFQPSSRTQVEGEEDQLAPRPPRQRVLQQREAADPLVVEHDDLAVDDRLPARQRRGRRRPGRRSGASSRARCG